MAMGNLSSKPELGADIARSGTPTAGGFRGSRSILATAVLYPQPRRGRVGSPPAINLQPSLRSIETSKSIDGAPGTFSIELKGGSVIPVAAGVAQISYLTDTQVVSPVDWRTEIGDDDWILLGINDGSRDWPIILGIVDTVDLSVTSTAGAMVRTWTVTGRDLTKVLVKTDLLMLPYVVHNLVLAYGTFYSGVTALAQMPGGASPGRVVKNLFQFMMRAGDQRIPGAIWWGVPPSVPAKFTAGVVPDANVRQATDMISDEHLDTDLPGEFFAYGSLMSAPDSGAQVWDILKDHSNDVLNELYVDLMPRKSKISSPLGFSAKTGSDFEITPAIVMRERPFASVLGNVPHRKNQDPWSSLPTTTMDVSDFRGPINVSQSGEERYNYFLVESGAGNSLSAMVMAMAATQTPGKSKSLLDGVPAIDVKSVERHGLRRMELKSLYINTKASKIKPGAIDIFAGWTRLIRDWYMLNHVFLSGVLTTAFAVPGVRVGERLLVWGIIPGELIQFYVERIAHRASVSDTGVVTSSSDITVTRGHVDPVGEISRFSDNFSGLSLSALASREDQVQVRREQAQADIERTEAAQAAAAGVVPTTPPGAPVADSPDSVIGTNPDGSSVVIPGETE